MLGSFGNFVSRDNAFNTKLVQGKSSFGRVNKKKRSLDVSVGEMQPSKARKLSSNKNGGRKAKQPSGTGSKLGRSPLEPLNPLKVFKLKVLRTSPPSGKTGATSLEGMHPAKRICRLTSNNERLSTRILRLEEQTCYWRRKSLNLESERDTLKSELSKARKQVESLEVERLKLQELLLKSEEGGKFCTSEIERLISENDDLKGVVDELNEEIEGLMKVEPAGACDTSMTEAPDAMAQALQEALADTMTDLTEKVEEIDVLKKALSQMSRQKSDLERVVTRQTLLSEMQTLDDNEDSKDDGGNEDAAKICRLQAAVEKCMFRIALLTEKNEQYKHSIREARKRAGLEFDPETQPGLLKTLKDGHKVHVLESLCMQRYRKLLRETAESMIGTSTQMDESF